MKGRAGSALWSSWIRSVSLKICFPCADPKLNDHLCAVRLKGISILGLRMYFKGRQIFLKASHAECLRLRQLVLCQRANVQTAGAQIHKMQVPPFMSFSGMCLDMYEPVYAHVRTALTYVPRRPMLMSYRSHYSIGIYMLWKSLESPTLNVCSTRQGRNSVFSLSLLHPSNQYHGRRTKENSKTPEGNVLAGVMSGALSGLVLVTGVYATK